ncbi:MAG: hypothetical protein ABL308_06570 [Oceanicaulis sp.]
MTVLRFSTLTAFALLLAACGETEGPDASPYAAGETDAEQVNTEPAAETVEDGETGEAEAPAEDGDQLSELDRIAREACEVGDQGFAENLPENAVFAARGPDARVHVGWVRDGSPRELIFYTPGLEDADRQALDMAVADVQRRNLVPGFDRSALTGVHRGQDGRFCVVQSEAEVVDPLVEIASRLEAAAQAPAE